MFQPSKAWLQVMNMVVASALMIYVLLKQVDILITKKPGATNTIPYTAYVVHLAVILIWWFGDTGFNHQI